jgi:hypothetical protein
MPQGEVLIQHIKLLSEGASAFVFSTLGKRHEMGSKSDGPIALQYSGVGFSRAYQ